MAGDGFRVGFPNLLMLSSVSCVAPMKMRQEVDGYKTALLRRLKIAVTSAEMRPIY